MPHLISSTAEDNIDRDCGHRLPRKVLELFSGIGGMSCAVKQLGLHPEPEVVSFDINEVANQVHELNFPDDKIFERNLVAVTAQELDKIGADVWTMSPPCQPFTCLGLQKDVDDKRSDCLRHLLQTVLPEMNQKPKFILLENVRGFETSRARDVLLETLRKLKYQWREFLLSPHQLGIPNSRTRYYLMAKLTNFPFDSDCILEEIASLSLLDSSCSSCMNTFFRNISQDQWQNLMFPKVPLKYFLDKYPSSDLLLTANELKYIQAMDIVTPSSERTCCFTRSYGHLFQGTGSVLQDDPSIDVEKAVKAYAESKDFKDLEQLKLRFFSPDEVARIMCFPPDFKFPPQTTRKQRYRLLGNSVNVKVVDLMLRFLFTESRFD